MAARAPIETLLGGRTLSRLILPRSVVKRVGRCIMFGCPPQETALATRIVDETTRKGRSLVMAYLSYRPQRTLLDCALGAEDYNEKFLSIEPDLARQAEHRMLFGKQGALADVAKMGAAVRRHAVTMKVRSAARQPHAVVLEDGSTQKEPVAVYTRIKPPKDLATTASYPDEDGTAGADADPSFGGPIPSYAAGRFATDTLVVSTVTNRILTRWETVWDVLQRRGSEAPSRSIEELRGATADAIQREVELQAEDAARAARSLAWLMGSIEELERRTWNRPDAREDFGSAVAKAA